MAETAFEIARGRAAQRLLDDTIFKAAFDETEAALRAALFETPADKPEWREDIYRRVRLLRGVRQAIQQHIDTGKLAEMTDG